MTEVRNLFFLLGSAVLAAALLVGGMVRYYSHEGVYQLDHVLLAPDTLSALHFEGDPDGGAQKDRFVFDSIAFLQYDAATRRLERHSVDVERYANFYDLVKRDKSLSPKEGKMAESFEGTGPRLLIQVRSANARMEGQARTFQELQFSPDGNYYRVELRHAGASREWAYFYHPGLLEQALTIFVPDHT
jgi:hypothetical protein